jgi:hypothetical protein
MKMHAYLVIGFATTALVFSGLFAAAQATEKSDTKKPAASNTAATIAKEHASPLASGRQDQFGHANGIATTSSSQQSADAAEAKKHLAGVKYEDRTAAQSNDATNAHLDAKGIQEKGLNSRPTGSVTSNEMAIKENGISSKPTTTAKPKQ